MKLSFSTIGCPAYVWTDIYPMAKDLGFDGIEIRGVAGNEFAPQARPFIPRQRQRTRAQLDRLGLEISCFSTSCELCTEDGRMQAMDDVVQYIELASEMGSPFVRVLLSRDFHLIGFTDDDAVVATLRQLADMASIYDVTILLETESDYADSARLARVLDAVDSPYVGALWDMQHPYRLFGEDPQTTIANLGRHLRYCQVKDSVVVDGRVQYRMMGEGDMPLVAMFDALQAAGYDGYVTFEWPRMWAREVAIGEPGIVFPQFINYMRDYLSGGLAIQDVPEESLEREALPTLESKITGELQHAIKGDGTYPWPKEHLIDLTFPQVLDHICEVYPNQYAFRFTEVDYTRTYVEFREDVNQFARALIAMGVRPGDKVAIWATNVPAWYLTFWASVKIGAVLVTVNTGYKVHELEYLLRQSDTHTLVMIDEYKGTSYLDIVDELVPELAQAGRAGAWHSAKFPCLRNVVTIDGPHPGCYSWDEALELAPRVKQAEVDFRCAQIRKDDVCNMQYTSGTTGFPKGVMLTHYNVVNNGKAIGDCMDLSTADRMMIQVPMFHCFGMVLAMTASMTHGVTMSPISAFSPRKGLACINKEKITCFHGVPTMFIAMMNVPEFETTDFSHMRTGIMAGSPCPIEKMREVIDRMNMKEICITYGQTEASPATTMSKTTDTVEQRVTTVGLPIFGVETKIIDPETGAELGDNEPGEFCSRGYNTMKGYYKMPEATAAAIDEDGWLHSGDILLRQPDGYFRVTGRLKDMIIRGGENVYPKEIEDFLYTFPKTKDVQVIGVPDKVYGEAVCAEIILQEGETATEEEVKEFCRARVAKEKIPQYVVFVDGYPMNEAGKIQKYKMREEAVELLGLQDAAAIKTA